MSSAWFAEGVTELLAFSTVRRNRIVTGLALAVALATPVVFLIAFGRLADEGVAARTVEIVAMAQRNQTAAVALMIGLGLSAYLSDASNGLLPVRLALGRAPVARGALVFGASCAAGTALACSLSAVVATVALGRAFAEPGFWLGSTLALTGTLYLHFLFGLLVALVTRSKPLAIGVGLMVPFVVLPLLKAMAGSVAPNSSDLIGWLLPTELASTLLAWAPGGNSLAAATTELLWLRALLLLAWLAAGCACWVGVIRRRPMYPADQG